MNEQHKNLSEDEISRILSRVGPLEAPPEEMANRVRSVVKDTWMEEVQNKKKQPHWHRYAAAVALFAVTGWFVLQPDTSVESIAVATIDTDSAGLEWSKDGKNWAPAAESLPVGYQLKSGQVASLTFHQGMNVRMQADSIVTLMAANEIHLQNGAIYLDSYESSSETPFLVTTEFGRATDIGTQFMVSKRDENWTVQVREGLVSVLDDAMDVTVSAGRKLMVNDENASETSLLPSDDASWAWAEQARPHFSIEGRTLSTYLEWVARETGRQLTYGNPEAEKLAHETRLHGSIGHLTASASLRFVLESTDLQLTDSHDSIIHIEL